MNPPLFSPLAMRSLALKNRIVVSPMCQYSADNGSANDWHLMHLGQFAMGAAGLLVTEATHVSPAARISPKCLGLYSDDNETQLCCVFNFCREFGVSALGIQLAHAGRKGSAHPPQKGGRPLTADEGAWPTVAPSPLAYAPDWPQPCVLDGAGLAEVTEAFVAAAERAVRIGFDLAELHMGHGYLLHQFLSPLSNRRGDGYGGGIAGRMRFPLEIFEAVRAVWPAERPLGVRVSATDWVPGGLELDDVITFCRALRSRGCDFIDITSGGLDPAQKISVGPGYQVKFAAAVREAVPGMVVWAVGMITDPHQANAIIAQEQADMVALARGMMWNPRWAWHAAEALGADTAYAERYARCHPDRWPQAFPGRAVTDRSPVEPGARL